MDPETTTEQTPAAPEGFDMDAAVSSIAEGLGFTEEPETPAESATPAEPGQEQPAQPEGDAGEQQPEQAEGTAAFSSQEAPDTWTKAAKEEWAKLSPTVQGEIRKREEDIARYVAETNPRLQVAEGFEKILEPYAGIFQQYNVNPWMHVSGLLNAHAKLLFGNPQEKATMAFALLKDAGIDPSKLTGQNPLDAIMPRDQELERLRGRLAQLESGVTSVTSNLAAQRTAELEQQVASFASDQAHPYFYEVWQEMESLLKTKVCKTLDEAYEKAVWGNPIVRDKEIARLNGEKQKRAEAARKTHLQSSRRAAGVNIQGSANASGAARPVGDWESSMNETLAEIRSRT